MIKVCMIVTFLYKVSKNNNKFHNNYNYILLSSRRSKRFVDQLINVSTAPK